MAFPKRHAPPCGIILALCLLAHLLLTGCGGQPLSSREIVHAVFFERQGDGFSACLLLADPSAGESDSPYKTASAWGETPAKALQNAENSVSGTISYGLTDLLALPADCDWSTAQALGELMYQKAQPMPELSVFLLDGTVDLEQEGDEIYTSLRAIEETEKIHCGLQQLFAKENVCAVPCRRAGDGYDFAILAKSSAPLRTTGLTASLAAALSRQTERMDATFASGAAAVQSKLTVTVQGQSVLLSLRDTQFTLLAEVPNPEQTLCAELEAAFEDLYAYTRTAQVDPFALDFAASCLYGAGSKAENPQLSVLFG